MTIQANFKANTVTGFNSIKAKLAQLNLPKEVEDSFICTAGKTVKFPIVLWNYTVIIHPTNPGYHENRERWAWLCANCGEYQQDWDLYPVYTRLDDSVYFFKSLYHATQFKLTWL